ncbi:flagellar hook-basal body complex protein [Roseicyclus sp.]|uniref:flagellar hook-basal body complex protein n=1 Tax=Roseicyclus sp. TaxID=1914329 RepID=UPI001BCBBC66|nr:flagellar hook-basal body complex protein [Roseicyclus sp.]
MSLTLSLSGAYAAQKSISVVSDNIANVGTTAFKSRNITFTDIVGSTPLGSPNSQTGSGVVAGAITKSFTNGSIATTGSATDLAVSGSAFFVTAAKDESLTDNTPRYNNYFTRSGSFNIDLDGYLVTAENYNVLDTDLQPIRLPTTTFSNIVADFSAASNSVPGENITDPINQAKLTFSVEDETVQLDWNEEQNTQLLPGEVFLNDGGVFFVPLNESSEPVSAIKVGEIKKNKANAIEVTFGDPVIKTTVKTLQMVDVERTFDVETQEIVIKQVTTSELVEVDKVEITNEKVYLDTFSTKIADFNSNAWTVVNERFYTEKKLINGHPSPPDTTYGNIESGTYSDYAISERYANDEGSESGDFLTSIATDGSMVTLRTENVRADRYQTTRGPYFHSNDPIFLQGGTTVQFDWNTRGSDDSYDVLAYLRNTNTGEYTIAVNETGKSSSDVKSGNFSFPVPEDGLYDLVFVGGTWDATGGTVAGAISSISNLTYQERDFEFQDVEKIVKVWEAQNVTRPVEEVITVIKQETRIVSELQEVMVDQDVPMSLDPSILSKIGSQIFAQQNARIEGFEVGPLELNVEFSPAEEAGVTSTIAMNLNDVTYLGQETTIDHFDSININTRGEISVVSNIDGNQGEIDIGTLAFTNPISTENFKYIRSGYFVMGSQFPTADIGSISDVAGGSVVQGALERSNVDLMSQLTELIKTQTTFNANSKAIQAYTDAYRLVQDIR